MTDINFAFFGTPDFAVTVLDELEKEGLTPTTVVTAPDKPQGRGMRITPPQVKIWAMERAISVLQPEKIDEQFLKKLREQRWDVFALAAYGKILPKALLNIPQNGVLNVHPSLLPKYRGPSPIESQILDDEKKIGVTIMLVDEEMDHGNILARKIFEIKNSNLPMRASVLESRLAHDGGKLLAKIMPRWVAGDIQTVTQNHEEATYTEKITKDDAHIDMAGDPYTNYLKFLAYDMWPRAHFFAEKAGKKVRVVIADAEFKDQKFVIKKVIREGKKEMDYKNFLTMDAR